MYHISKLPKNAYLYHLQSQMSSYTDFGQERFTGFFLGPLFLVTHHCEYEWNRKISCQKNTAFGLVRTLGAGSQIHYFTVKGPLRPQGILFYLLIGILMSLYFSWQTPGIFLPVFGMYCALLCVCLPLGTLIESLTENSKYGAQKLRLLMMDPSDPYDVV